MLASSDHTHFDFATLTERERYKLLIGTVIPRPIALVTTLSRDGKANAGPFSFFNVLSHDPPIVAIGVENHADMAFKDTARNIRETEEFTVHICDNAMVEQMEICAIKFGPEVDELAEAGFATAPGRLVRSPRILAAPAALECRRYMTLEIGKAREIILGQVLGLFVRAEAVNPENLHIDQHAMDAIGRLGGYSYVRTQDQFEIKTKTPDQYFAGKAEQDKATSASARGLSGSGEKTMAHVTYDIVEHDGGFAYKVGDVFSETFPTHQAAHEAAEAAARRQQVGGRDEAIQYQDSKGKWHEEQADGGDRPETDVEDDLKD